MNMWGITDRGVVREENQDAYALLDLSDRQQLAVVCDGMGGARAGNIASTMAVEEFSNVFSELWNTGERKGQEPLPGQTRRSITVPWPTADATAWGRPWWLSIWTGKRLWS